MSTTVSAGGMATEAIDGSGMIYSASRGDYDTAGSIAIAANDSRCTKG